MEIAVAETLDETLKLDMNTLKSNILKELPYAEIGDTEGDYPLTVTLKYGIYSINQYGKIEKFKGITLDEEEITIQVKDGVGEERNIKATLVGMNGNISWKSEDTGIATVDSTGKVTAVAEGTTKIIASCEGKSASCNVTVEKFVSINSIILKIGGTEVDYSTTRNEEIIKNKTKELVITAEINNDATEELQWSTTGTSEVSMETSEDKKTKATLTLKGEASEITILVQNGEKTVSKTLKIKITEIPAFEAKDVTKAMMENNVVVDYVEYTRSGGTKSTDWQVLYADNKNIYLIMKWQTKNPAGALTLNAGVNTNYKTGTAMLSNVMTEGSSAAKRFPAVKDGWLYKWDQAGRPANARDNSQTVMYLLDSNVWNYCLGDYRRVGDWSVQRGNCLKLLLINLILLIKRHL